MFSTNRLLVPLFIITIVILAACQKAIPTQFAQTNDPVQVIGTPVSVSGGTYEDITPKMLNSLLAKKNFTLINVHTPFAGNISQTDLSIPYDQIDQNLDKLPAAKDAKIVLYCSSGHMSSIAAKKLVEMGYTNVWNLVGGMSAWQKAGLPLERTQ